ncbi:lipoprotein-releasing system ATP-binding protein LolD [Methanosarcinales archaeon]|nr:MAG: lipoprotein-releasing system ATP-binding protein LolD [Methanosarcinales archaeon]
MSHVSEAALRLENVTKLYEIGSEKIYALDNVSLSICEGEFLTVMGPSGSGKSTLLNMMGCLDLPTSGSIYIDDMDVTSLEDEKLTQIRRDKIGFIFQQFNLIPTLTAQENIELPMVIKRIPQDECTQAAKRLLSIVNLAEKFADHLPGELSSGQQQRVAIGRALANDPAIILADEPTGNLDTKTGKGIMELLKRLNEGGKTIIVVTHDPNLSKYSNREIRIVDGRIEEDVSEARQA